MTEAAQNETTPESNSIQSLEEIDQRDARRQAGFWADGIVVLIHLAGFAYLIWVLVIMVPQYKQLFEEFEIALPGSAMTIIQISDILESIGLLLLPLAAVCFAVIDYLIVRKSVGLWWRPLWIFGLLAAGLIVAGAIQFLFVSLLPIVDIYSAFQITVACSGGVASCFQGLFGSDSRHTYPGQDLSEHTSQETPPA